MISKLKNKDIVERVCVDVDVDVKSGKTTSTIIIGRILPSTPQISDIPSTNGTIMIYIPWLN